MQFKLRFRRESLAANAIILTACFGLNVFDTAPALAKTPPKHPKGFVHNTAGDGVQQMPTAAAGGAVPTWIQYDNGGVYYYQHNDMAKAREYFMYSYKIASTAVPAERLKGLTPAHVNACCNLVKHLTWLVSDSKFKSKNEHYGLDNLQNSDPRRNLQTQLDNILASLRQMYRDWDWYERVQNFADRALGKQRDCTLFVASARQQFEREIVFKRMQGQTFERQLGIDPKNSAIDTRPLKWGGVSGGDNPFMAPGSDNLPVEFRGGKDPYNNTANPNPITNGIGPLNGAGLIPPPVNINEPLPQPPKDGNK